MAVLEVHIDRDADAEGVSGTVRDHGAGVAVPFVGWVGLLALLQQAISEVRTGTGP